MSNRDQLSLNEARRIALAAQGFDRPRPARKIQARDVRRTIHQLGLLQIDYVNVVIPSHYQVLFSRLGPYEKSLLGELVYRRREFTEQWAHEASILPVESWPLLRHRMQTHRVRPYGFESFIQRQPDYVEWVLEQVRARGPLTADQLAGPDDGSHRLEHSWFKSVPRAVLEAHFGSGRLAVAERRSDFARVYDLTERVLPDEHLAINLEKEDAQRQLLRLAARSHGVGTAADLADYYRIPVRDARPRIGELVAARHLLEVRVEGWRDPAYLHPEARVPDRIDTGALLSPFDPVIWFRARAARLFNFDYRFEIFVPQAKRKWGCYVLPFLLGDRLVARVNLKSDRAAGRLLVLGAYLERGQDAGAVGDALARELRTLAGWLGLESVAVAPGGGFARLLSAAVRH